MFRPRNKDPRLLQLRDFRCTVCGTIRPAAKRRAKTKPGHIKTMWCARCRAETDHVQLGGGEDDIPDESGCVKIKRGDDDGKNRP